MNDFEEQVKRFCDLRKRIYDPKNEKDWGNGELPDTDFRGIKMKCNDLSDQDKFVVICLANRLHHRYTLNDHLVEVFYWDEDKAIEVANKEECIKDKSVMTEDGLLLMKAYDVFEEVFRDAMKLYRDYLWKDLPVAEDASSPIIVNVEIPNIYSGKCKSYQWTDDNLTVMPPIYYAKECEYENWPKDRNDYYTSMEISWGYVKGWKQSW